MLEYATFSHPPLDKTIDALRSISDNPWRTFENYLLEYKPAIGFPHFSWHLRDDSLEVQSVPMFDAMITAFHFDIWNFVFPYESRWDDKVCRVCFSCVCRAIMMSPSVVFFVVRCRERGCALVT